jgi:hypothetical protein
MVCGCHSLHFIIVSYNHYFKNGSKSHAYIDFFLHQGIGAGTKIYALQIEVLAQLLVN